MINPLAAFRDGYNAAQGFRDQYAQRQAGNALAGGDYRGASNALLQNGMLGDGMEVMQAGQTRDKAAADAAKLRQGEGLKAILDGGQSLLKVPADQRAAVYQSQLVPLLKARGVPDELLQQMGQSTFTDQELQTFITGLGGELQKPEWQILNMGARGAYAVNAADPTQRQTLFEPQAETSKLYKGPDGYYERLPDGTVVKVANFGPAPRTFAPQRRSGGNGGAPAPARSYGSGEEPQW